MTEYAPGANTGKCGGSRIARTFQQGGYKKAIPKDIRKELSSLQNKDNWHNVFYLGLDWLVIAVAIAAAVASSINPLVYAAAVIVIGSRQRALMNLVHEASHKKLFRNRIANDRVGKLLSAWPLLSSLSAYTCAHCRHHGYLWNEEKDPKTAAYRALGLLSIPENRRQFLFRYLVKPFFLMHVTRNVAGSISWEGEPRSETVGRIVFWAVLLGTVSASGLIVPFFLFWVVPFLTSFQIIRYWNETAEHAGLQTDDPWMATRNWNSSLLGRFLLAPHSDDLYHLTHHLFPLIPHYRLAAAHRLLMRVPEYARGHHCDGFFWPRRANAPSVIQDIWRPQAIRNYTPWEGACIRSSEHHQSETVSQGHASLVSPEANG